MASEFEPWYCLPAAMQTMINIMEPGRPDRTLRTQERLYRLARRYSSEKLWGKGAEPIGWARALERLGYGDWEVVAYRRRADAIKVAVKRLRMTGKPVGMLTWRGAHSWVISGFSATADPALTNRYRVTRIVIEDVWYPRVSTIWGPSDPPGTWMRADDLGRDYLRYKRPGRRYPGLDGNYVLVVPVPKGPSILRGVSCGAYDAHPPRRRRAPGFARRGGGDGRLGRCRLRRHTRRGAARR